MGTIANYKRGLILSGTGKEKDTGDHSMEYERKERFSTKAGELCVSFSRLDLMRSSLALGAQKLGLVQLPFGHLECRHTVDCFLLDYPNSFLFQK